MQTTIQTLIICVMLGLVTAAIYTDCGSKGGKITNVTVNNCTAVPCMLKKETNVSFVMDFNALVDITSATTKVYGEIAGVLVPFPMPDPNSCDFMKCPAKTGDAEVYSAKLFVKSEYPAISVIVVWKIMSGSDVITCFAVPVKLVS